MVMKLALAVFTSLSLFACAASDQAVSGTVSDTQALAEAEAAANEVIRNASDCEAVTATFSAAMAPLAEVEGRLQTAAGRTTLDTLKRQVSRIGEACGAR
jgi:hypothetical protein